MNMHNYFSVGDTIYGFCNGFFGRDDYEKKVCVEVRPKYAVFEYESGFAVVLNLQDRLARHMVAKWKQETKT